MGREGRSSFFERRNGVSSTWSFLNSVGLQKILDLKLMLKNSKNTFLLEKCGGLWVISGTAFLSKNTSQADIIGEGVKVCDFK